jgi:hypothetical protein
MDNAIDAYVHTTWSFSSEEIALKEIHIVAL